MTFVDLPPLDRSVMRLRIHDAFAFDGDLAAAGFNELRA